MTARCSARGRAGARPVTGVNDVNDLYLGEPASFQFLIDGKPAANLAVGLVADGARCRSAVDEQACTTDAEGRITIDWPGPGLYWLSAMLEDDEAVKPATHRRSSYSAVFEVLTP